MSTAIRESLQDRLDRSREANEVPGASVAVLQDGAVTSAASGVLNVDTGVEATTDSLFQIGSITKVWTATVVMQLVEEGSVELDAPLRTYVPEFRVADESVAERVTIRHLLTHSSGIDGDNFSDTGRGDGALERYVTTCAELQQLHSLGSTMSYCNTGFSVLGRVIEVVTGKVWDTAMRERLFEPLQLTHTATLPEDVLRFRAAIGHIRPQGDIVTAPMWGLPRSAGPAGAICSTAADVARFAQLHLEGGTLDGTQILSAASVRAMQQPQIDVPGGGAGGGGSRWGLGWVLFDWGGRGLLGHDGGTIGQAAFLRVVPDANVAVVLLTNGGNPIALFRELCGELLADVAGVEMPAALEPPADALAFEPSEYAGVYAREGASFEVLERDGALVAVQTVTGLGSEMTPEPIDLPLHRLREDDDMFVTQHPAAPGMWLPVAFLSLDDGTRVMHVGGRATPRV